MADPLAQNRGGFFVFVVHALEVDGLRLAGELRDHLVIGFDGRHLPAEKGVQNVNVARRYIVFGGDRRCSV
jgi:hypothetical protein